MVTMTHDLRSSLCKLFQVIADEDGVSRVVTPLSYPGSGDQVVVRVRPSETGFRIDESGDAAFLATLMGGDLDAEPVSRWAHDLHLYSPAILDADDVIVAEAPTIDHVAPYVIRVAEAAQQLHAIATSRAERTTSNFKQRLAELVWAAAKNLALKIESDVQLPIAGGLEADHVIYIERPIILIAANSASRLLEAEVICMQYRSEKKPGRVIAIAESQNSVGKKQFERAGYYTDRTVVFNEDAIGPLILQEASAI